MFEPTFSQPPTEQSHPGSSMPASAATDPTAAEAADNEAAAYGTVAADPTVSETAAYGGAAPTTPARNRRRRGDIGMVLAASILSAVVASGATAALVPRPATMTAATTTTPASAAGTTAAGVMTAATTSPSVAALAAASSPAVVTIDTTVTSQVRGSRGAPSGTGVGSGFIYNADGYILTAAHVVEGASQITVTLQDGRTFNGTVAARDLALDVAVVKIEASGLPTISLGKSSALKIGQTVLAIGDPLGEYPGSVTVGIVSGLDRSVTVADELTRQGRDLTGLIQTDAAINQGNSGGPLIDTSGSVIGIISAGSSSAQGIGFAVPIDTAAALMAALKTA